MRRPATADRMLCITVDAGLCVDGLCLTDGYTNEGIAQQMALYQEAVSSTPQMA